MKALPAGEHSVNTPTVAARSDVGPREVNEDRSFTALSAEDGACVIAVAAGHGGHPRAAEAAEAAVAVLPLRIASEVDMEAAFVTAHRAVAALAPSLTAWRSSPEQCPMTTLCVAAWTPEGGLIVAFMGDTLPVLILWPDPDSADGHYLGAIHRGIFGLTGCLGADPRRTRPEGGGAEFHLELWENLDGEFAEEWAVVVASDGVWEKLALGRDGADSCTVYSLCVRVAAFVGPAGRPAERIAEDLLAAARDRGLDDNATVAVAHMALVGRAS